MTTEVIKEKVISVADNSSTEIILKVYQYMIDKHQSFCTCDYCCLLKRYVLEKKNFHRIKHKLYENEIKEKKQNIKFWKIQKDKLKQIKLK